MDTQAKFERIVAALIATAGLEFVIDRRNPRRGTIRAQRPDEFGDILTLKYDWAGDCAHFALSWNGAEDPLRSMVTFAQLTKYTHALRLGLEVRTLAPQASTAKGTAGSRAAH
jgi:hypothetical protein